MKFYLVLSILLLSSLVNAAGPRVDNTKLFVKLAKNSRVPQNELIKNAKYLFNSYYLLETSNAKALASELKLSKNVIKTQFNKYSGSQDLPKVQKTKDSYDSFISSVFNDARVGRVWSFKDASNHGVSVEKSYLAPVSAGEQTEIIVAVVDTGVDYKHDDLQDVMWVNKSEIPGNGIDDDENGYIDDIHGINTLKRRDDGSAFGNPMASHSHGTHVAGTIGATQNNNVGIAGIASKVKIMAIRAVPDDSDETDADVVESFLYAAQNGAKLINCSFGKSINEDGDIVKETIEHIGKTYGVLVLAAAGNDYGRDIDSDRAFPASFNTDYLLVVASTTKYGRMSWFSNVGEKSVDLAAPGSDIYSTVKGNQYANMSGTSMATPTTTGVAAKVLNHFPELGPLELKKVLMESVTPVSSFAGRMVSPGRVDLYNSLMFTLENYNSL